MMRFLPRTGALLAALAWATAAIGQDIPTVTLAAPAAAVAPAVAEVASGAPLTLDEVLASADAYFPLLFAVEQERQIAAGQLLSAQGAFDLQFRTRANNIPLGTFERYTLDAMFDQPIAASGASAFAGYRYGYGSFQDYYGMAKTADGGEFRAGLAQPLLRDRAIDRRRTNLRLAILGVQVAEPTIMRQRIDCFRGAGRAYWNWVSAGHRLRLSRQSLALAEQRIEQLRERVRLKLMAAIDLTDNERLVAERQARLTRFQRQFEQASIELSLYLRGPDGMPCLPTESRVPGFPAMPPPDINRLPTAIQCAAELRPEPRRLRLLRERSAAELRFAENQTLPGASLTIAGAQDIGSSPATKPEASKLDRSSFDVGLNVDLPVQRRDARGRVQTAQAQMAQYLAMERYAVDQITAEVRDAFSALGRSQEQRENLARSVRLTQEVLDAENERLRIGTGDLLRIVLREISLFDAQVAEVDGCFDYFRALVDFNAALGFAGPSSPVPVQPTASK